MFCSYTRSNHAGKALEITGFMRPARVETRWQSASRSLRIAAMMKFEFALAAAMPNPPRTGAWARLAPVGLLLGLFVSQGHAAQAPLWLNQGRPTQQAVDMLRMLSMADQHGLRPADYAMKLSAAELRAVMTGSEDSALSADFDAALTSAAARFVKHVARGRVPAAAAGFNLPKEKIPLDVNGIVRDLATASDLSATLALYEPAPLPYRSLQQALARYRTLATRLESVALPSLPKAKLELNDSYRGAPALRKLLVELGDLDGGKAAAQAPAENIDPELAAAIARFQARHGLQADGVIGSRTYAALNTPISQRVRQIELTMERWRWLAALPRPDIVINIPQFMLYALPRPKEAPQRVVEMPVIVGKSQTRTPIFTASIEQVIFQPFWDVPASIARKELLPKIRKDPSYLERHHFEIVRGQSDNAKPVAPSPEAFDALAAGQLRIRQRPGPDNALGPVKFVLPNPYEVRLHGTSEPKLFEQYRRAFSHGCIRVSDPAALAQYVLQNAAETWTTEAVDAAMCGKQTLRVVLEEPVKVVVFYATAAATESRGVLFCADIYGHDRRLQKLLDGAVSSD